MKRLFVLLLGLVLLWSCESNETKGSRFFLKGNEALADGNYKEAIRLYTEAIDKYPELQDAYNNRGVAYYKSGDYFHAIEDYDKLIMTMNAMNFDARGNIVDAYIASGRNEDALKQLKWVKDFYPDSANIDFKMGLANFGLKEYRASVVSFLNCYKKDSSNTEALVNAANGYFFNNDFDRAYARLDEAERKDPSIANIYNTRCMIAITNRNYDFAMEQITKALEIESSNGIFLNNRGFLKLMKGDLEGGGKDVDRAIVSDPLNAWAYRNKGIYYYMSDKIEDAVRNFEQAAKLEDDMPFLDYYWGASLIKLDRMDEACGKLRKSVDRFENEGRELFTKNCGAI